MDERRVGKNIKKLRKERGLSLNELAEMIGKKGKVYLNTTNPDVSSVAGRKAGFERALKEYPNVTLVGFDPDPLRSREHILLTNIFQHAWKEGQDLDLAQLILQVQKPEPRPVPGSCKGIR